MSDSFLERLLVFPVDAAFATKRLLKGVAIRRAEAVVQVPPPALGMPELARHPADLARQVVHRLEVGVEALAGVEPVLLRVVRLQRLELFGLHRRRVHELAGNNAPPQRIAEAVRHGVVDRHVMTVCLRRRRTFKIGHAVGEGALDG